MSQVTALPPRHLPCTTSTSAHTAGVLDFAPLIPPEPIKSRSPKPKAESVGAVGGTLKGNNVESRVPNAASREALEEIKTGKLNRYVDEDELFRKLGIKVGKT